MNTLCEVNSRTETLIQGKMLFEGEKWYKGVVEQYTPNPTLQGYRAYKNTPPPQDLAVALCLGPNGGPRGGEGGLRAGYPCTRCTIYFIFGEDFIQRAWDVSSTNHARGIKTSTSDIFGGKYLES